MLLNKFNTFESAGYDQFKLYYTNTLMNSLLPMHEGSFDYDLNDRTRNNGAKLIVKHFNTSVAQHFYPIKITTTWNVLPSEVVSSRTVNSFKNSLVKHWAENSPNVRVNWQQSTMPCTIQVCTNSRRPAFCWKWTQRSVLLLLLLLLTVWKIMHILDAKILHYEHFFTQ